MKRMVVGLSGASGAVMAVKLLQALKNLGVETHLVATKTGLLTLKYETEMGANELKTMADHWHHPDDFAASISSGSFQTMGMMVVPCSVSSLAEIASGLSTNLLTRAADVTLKERRPLLLMLRETPLTLAHIENMQKITLMGGIIFPPVPAFYAKPKDLDDMVAHLIGRAIDLFDLDAGLVERWE